MDFKSAIVLPVAFLVACSGGDNIAKVGSESITQQAFDAHLTFKRVNPDQTDRVEAELDRYLQQTALAQAIESAETLDAALLEAEFAEFKKQMLVSRYMTAYLDATVTDAAVQNYYNANQEEFSRQQAHVAHIVFRVHNAMTDAEKQAAQQKAREVIAKLAKGEEFADLAQNYSEDLYSAENGGDIGWVQAETIDPDFSKAVFELDANQHSDVIETQYGYHIIKLLEPMKQDVAPFTQVEGDIRYQLRQKAKIAETERLLSLVDITIAE
jgi:peptidyl-prolyl cis-trans isomerase C